MSKDARFTLDLFADRNNLAREYPDLVWPDSARFPLNLDVDVGSLGIPRRRRTYPLQSDVRSCGGARVLQPPDPLPLFRQPQGVFTTKLTR
jgi:hypothetical protein